MISSWLLFPLAFVAALGGWFVGRASGMRYMIALRRAWSAEADPKDGQLLVKRVGEPLGLLVCKHSPPGARSDDTARWCPGCGALRLPGEGEWRKPNMHSIVVGMATLGAPIENVGDGTIAAMTKGGDA